VWAYDTDRWAGPTEWLPARCVFFEHGIEASAKSDAAAEVRLAAMLRLLVFDVDSDGEHYGLQHAAVERAERVRCRSSHGTAAQQTLALHSCHVALPHQLRRLAAAIAAASNVAAIAAASNVAASAVAAQPSGTSAPPPPPRPSPSPPPIVLRVVHVRTHRRRAWAYAPSYDGLSGVNDGLHVCTSETLTSLCVRQMDTDADAAARRKRSSPQARPRLLWLASLGVFVEVPDAPRASALQLEALPPPSVTVAHDREGDDFSDCYSYGWPEDDDVYDPGCWHMWGVPVYGCGRGSVDVDKSWHERKRWRDASHSRHTHSGGQQRTRSAVCRNAHRGRAAARTRAVERLRRAAGITASDSAGPEREQAVVREHGFILQEGVRAVLKEYAGPEMDETPRRRRRAAAQRRGHATQTGGGAPTHAPPPPSRRAADAKKAWVHHPHLDTHARMHERKPKQARARAWAQEVSCGVADCAAGWGAMRPSCDCE